MISQAIPHHKYWMPTRSGGLVDFINPDSSSFSILDIVAGLARANRFAGQIKANYSVLEHSLWVADYVTRKHGDCYLALAALLHDAAEAYTGDIPASFKHLPDIKDAIARHEQRLMKAIFKSLKVGWPCSEQWQLIKEADAQALAFEAREFSTNAAFIDFMPALDATALSVEFEHQHEGVEALSDVFLRYFFQLSHLVRSEVNCV